MIRIVTLPFLIPDWAAAQVLFPNMIFVNRKHERYVTAHLLAHEIVHVMQIRELGLLRYWWKYLWLARKHKHSSHPMEQDARKRAYDEVIAEQAESLFDEFQEQR